MPTTLVCLVILACCAELARAQSLSPPAQSRALSPSPQTFQVEWQQRSGHMRPGIEGYVYNSSGYRIGSVRLKIDVLDNDGRVIREQFAWVFGAIDAGGRGYFVLQPLRPGETCRIAVESFDLLSRQAP